MGADMVAVRRSNHAEGPGENMACTTPQRRRRSKKRGRRDRCSDVADCADCGDLDCCSLSLVLLLVSVLRAVPATPVQRSAPYGSRTALRLVEAYRLHVSPQRPAVCNLSPTCSRFGRDALRERGLRAVPAIVVRLAECSRAA